MSNAPQQVAPFASAPPCDLGVKSSRRGTAIAADQRATAQRIYHTAITGGGVSKQLLGSSIPEVPPSRQ
jgi:hypothetical protein